jgi:hypothetical protein
MGRFLKWFLAIVVVLGIIAYFSFQRMKKETKKASPEESVTTVIDGASLKINYSRPYKKGRDIFGALVPYRQVWRTGANEATTFSTDQPITFGGKSVAAGTYTLWTIPDQDKWQVILNGKEYPWGVDFNGVASREADSDVANVSAPVTLLNDTVEQFTIRFDQRPEPHMVLEWDLTQVAVPISR